MTVEELRKQIDELDERMAALFLQRTELVQKIGAIKKEQGLAVEDKRREDAVLNRLVEKYGEDSRAHLSALYRAVFDYCKNLQK